MHDPLSLNHKRSFWFRIIIAAQELKYQAKFLKLSRWELLWHLIKIYPFFWYEQKMMDTMVMRTPEPRSNLSLQAGPSRTSTWRWMRALLSVQKPRGGFSIHESVGCSGHWKTWAGVLNTHSQEGWTPSRKSWANAQPVSPWHTALGFQLSTGRACICLNCPVHLRRQTLCEGGNTCFFPHCSVSPRQKLSHLCIPPAFCLFPPSS